MVVMSLNIHFVKSAVNKNDYPRDRRPELAVVGRSNAGKSSLLNALAQRKVAKVSQKPGRTTTLNFFLVNEVFYFVDMPGYGFAGRSASERGSWGTMVEGYLAHRKNLRGLILVMDVRREWSTDEEMLINWSGQRPIPLLVILSKTDKVGQGERVKKSRAISQIPGVAGDLCVSSKTKRGLNELEEFIFARWLQS